MMPVLAGSTLSSADVVALIEGADTAMSLRVELLDADDNLIEDITDDVEAVGGEVQYEIYRTLHATCRLRIKRELQWGSQRVRLFKLYSDDVSGVDYLLDEDDEPLLDEEYAPMVSGSVVEPTWYEWPLGVFLLETPARMIGDTPAVWEVEGYSKLDILNTEHGATYTVPAGSAILAAAEALIADAGEAKVRFDQTGAATTAPTDRVYSIVDRWTTLGIINDLMQAIGYRAAYVDADGWFTSEPYRPPSELATMWTYSPDSATTTVAEDRTATQDFYHAANVVVGVNNDVEADLPVEDDGIARRENQSDGPTSIDERGGRRITRRVDGSFADQAALQAHVDEILDNEKRITTHLELTVGPNPLLGHFSVARYVDAAVPTDARFLVTGWVMPLDNESNMTVTMREV